MPVASVFISYSHADKPLAKTLANGLGERDFRVWVDEGEIRVGDSLVDKVTDAIDRVDFVVAIVSEASVASPWCQKELSLAMTGEIAKQGITVLPCRVDDVVMPATLKDKKYQELDRENLEDAVSNLVRDMSSFLSPPQPLPPRRRQPTSVAAKDADPSEPIRLIAVDIENVGTPRNDGTRGSALYKVPILLNRTPSQAWVNLFVPNWDRPSSWSTMHRPGIASVQVNRIILDGTTVDEVASVHQATLKLAVQATNEQFEALERSEQRQREAREAALIAHRQEVDLANARITFE